MNCNEIAEAEDRKAESGTRNTDMKMNLQCDERRMSQVTTSLFRREEMRICHSQMRHTSFPLERHPNTRRAGISLRLNEDGGVQEYWLQRGGFRGRPEGAGEEMVHRHTGITHPPRRKLPWLVPRLCCKKVSEFTPVSFARQWKHTILQL